MNSPPYKVYEVHMLKAYPFGDMDGRLQKSLTYYVGNGWEVLSLTPTLFSEDRTKVLEMCLVIQKDK